GPAPVNCLREGNSIRSTCRLTGAAKNTVVKLLVELGCACAVYHHEHVRNVKARRVQCDEIWSFVGAKNKNTTAEQRRDGMGDAWKWVALDADTKLFISTGASGGTKGAGAIQEAGLMNFKLTQDPTRREVDRPASYRA
ncbi:MAG: hypothetical protein ACRD1E_06300, partial [Terriglobales bacterium]